MNNKALAWAGILAVAGLCGASGIQAAGDSAWYLGAGGGQAHVKKTSSWSEQTDAALRTQGLTSNTQIESNESAWKIFGGYQFNENWAAEAAYNKLGNFKGTSTITAPVAAAPGGTWEVYAVSLTAVGIYPFANRYAVFGKLGLAGTRLTVSLASPANYNPSATRVQPLLGVGARFDVTKAIGIRAEFERFNNVGDGSTTGQSGMNVYSLSGQYRF
jgi:OOP family OmpA-OmpF porin